MVKEVTETEKCIIKVSKEDGWRVKKIFQMYVAEKSWTALYCPLSIVWEIFLQGKVWKRTNTGWVGGSGAGKHGEKKWRQEVKWWQLSWQHILLSHRDCLSLKTDMSWQWKHEKWNWECKKVKVKKIVRRTNSRNTNGDNCPDFWHISASHWHWSSKKSEAQKFKVKVKI